MFFLVSLFIRRWFLLHIHFSNWSTNTGPVSSVMPVLSYVIQKLTCQQYSRCTSCSSVQYQEQPSDTLGKVDRDSLEQLPLSFRLCMANVLISTCQKLHGSGKLLFVQQIFPALLHFVEVILPHPC